MSKLTDLERIAVCAVRKLIGMLRLDNFEKVCRKPEPGDLVICASNWNHEWGLAIYEGCHDSGRGPGGVIRQLNTGQLCNMSNEEFYVIDVHPTDLIRGDERVFRTKVIRAMARFNNGSKRNPKDLDTYNRFCDLRFNEDKATIRYRPMWQTDHPFKRVILSFRPKASIVSIQREMIERGYE